MIVEFLNFGLNSLIVFCRVGACLLIAPAVASSRIPVSFRLYIALSLAALISPSAIIESTDSVATIPAITLTIFSETLIGILLGLSVRFLFLALEVMGELISMSIGLTNNLGVSIEGMDPSPIVTSFLSILVLTLLLILDLHHKLISGIADTYRVMPIGFRFSLSNSLKDVVDMISNAFFIVIRIASPFIFFSILVNFCFGIMNKIIPQFPAFFISLPFIIYGGIIILYITISPAAIFFIISVSETMR